MLHSVLILAGIAFGVYCLAALALLYFENSLIFFPTAGGVGKPPEHGEDVFLTASDGIKIHGWYVTNPEARVSLLVFHGNAGNLEDRREWIDGLRALPANVLMIDYRGYGRSDPRAPSEKTVYLDARAAYAWLAARQAGPIVIYGESLGGAVAAQMATESKCAGLILQSTFTTAGDMAGRIAPYFPMRWLIRTSFDTLSHVRTLAVPKLILHARDDEVIPFSMGEQLCSASREPKTCHWFERGGHNGIFVTMSGEYYGELSRFLARVSVQGAS